MSTHKNIPPEIRSILDASVRRVRGILLFRGTCAALAALVASMLAIMAIDAMVTIYASWVRWALWAAGLVFTCSVAYFALVKPLRRKFTAAEIASLIERNHPELEERLSTVVELAEAGDIGASSRLMSEITKDAVKDAGKVSPKKEFTGRTVKPRLVAAAVALGILGALFALFPKATLRLATRAIMPSAEVDNIYASSLKVSPGDQVVLVGTPVTVNLAVDGGFPSRAFVRTRPDGKGESVERMVRVSEEGAEGPVFYSFSYPRVTSSFRYRISCGSALTRSYRVEAVPEPTYSDRVVEIVHPQYTGREPERYTNTAAVVGIAGSKVKVSARPSREGIEGVAKLPGDRTVYGSPSHDGRLEFSFDLTPELQGTWSTVVWDSNGFTSQVDQASITVAKDTPPEVKLVTPEKLELKLPRNGSLPVEFEAKDDFGVARAVLEMCIGAGQWTDAGPVEVTKEGEFTWDGTHVVKFLSEASNVDFKNAATVRYRIRIEDNLPAELGGPGVARTPEIQVQLAARWEKSFARQSLSGQIDEARKEIRTAVDHLREARHNFEWAASNYEKSANNEWHRKEALKNSEKAKAAAQNAEGLLSEFVDSLMDSRLETGAEMFRPILEKRLTPIRQGAEDIFLMARREEKRDSNRRLMKDAESAIKALEEAQRKFDILTKTAEDLQRIEEIAEREKLLSEMAEEGEIEAKDLAEEEQKLLDDLRDEIRDDLAKNLDRQKEKAKELQDRGRDLEKRQEDLRGKAQEAAKNNDEGAMKAAADEEDRLAHDIDEFRKQTEALTRDIEKQAGTTEMDPNKTAEPTEQASDKARSAAEDARSATEKMRNGDAQGADENMKNAKDALAEAQEKLAEAQKRMDAKNGDFAESANELRDMEKSMDEAVKAAWEAAEAERKAAEAAAQQQAAQQGQQQGEQQQQGDQQGQQQGQQQTPQMQNAAQKAAAAAEKVKNQANSRAEKNNMPIDQFESPDRQQQSSQSQQGQQSENSKSTSESKSSLPDRGRARKARKVPQGVFGEQGEDENWFKMKSESGTGAEVDSLDDVPAEYRGLVRDYFEALNKGGSKK